MTIHCHSSGVMILISVQVVFDLHRIVLVQCTSLLASMWWAHNWISQYPIASSLRPHPPFYCLQYGKKGVARAQKVWSCDHNVISKQLQWNGNVSHVQPTTCQHFLSMTITSCWRYKLIDVFLLAILIESHCAQPHYQLKVFYHSLPLMFLMW